MEEAWELAVVSEFLEALQKVFAESSGLNFLALTLGAVVGLAASGQFLRQLPKTLEPLLRSVLSVSEVSDLLIKKQIESVERITDSNDGVSSLEITFDELDKLLSAANKDPFKNEDGTPVDDWKQALILSRARLVEETERLSARSAMNLIIGIVISILGILILAIALFVFGPEATPSGFYEFTSVYLSRFLLVLSVQVLAAFFLRMYVTMERDIKSNKNEITNIELRYTAGLLATDKKTSLKDIAMVLAKEERNSILPNAKDSKNDEKVLKQLVQLEKLVSKIGS